MPRPAGRGGFRFEIADRRPQSRPAGNQTEPFAVPELTSIPAVKLNFQVSLRHRRPALTISGDREGLKLKRRDLRS